MKSDSEEEMGANFADGKVDNDDKKGSDKGENGGDETGKG